MPENKFMEHYGKDFNRAIIEWQESSSGIRKFFLSGIIPEFTRDKTGKTSILDVMNSLRAFWKVMTRQDGYDIQTFSKSTILFRGVKRRDILEVKGGSGYVMVNTLTNWTSSPKIAHNFTESGCCLMQCLFPQGTKFFYTGESRKEFEHIIPGGMFVMSTAPKNVISPYNSLISPSHKQVLFILKYIPIVKNLITGQVWNQFFPWPTDNPSPDTRTTYQREFTTKVAPILLPPPPPPQIPY
jgi:hypothetical protein